MDENFTLSWGDLLNSASKQAANSRGSAVALLEWLIIWDSLFTASLAEFKSKLQ